ncbi:hypothetical protein V1509DRAFT_615645 [Lipomyces kononenkoae]
MLAADPSRSNATQDWVNSTDPPARRPPANRLPKTELTKDDRLRNAAASTAIDSTSPKTGASTTNATATAAASRRFSASRQEETRPGQTDLAAKSAMTSLRGHSGRYANPVDLPSHPIVGVDKSCSNKAALLAGNVQVKEMWKPTGTSATAASAAMLAHSSPKSPELWKPDPATSAGLAEILSKDPKYTITSQTGSGGGARPAAAHKQPSSTQQLHAGGHRTPPLSPKMDTTSGASRYSMAPSAANAAHNAPPTPPSPVETDERELSRGAAGAALNGKQPRQNYVESKSVPSTQVQNYAALEEAAKRAAAARLSTIGEPQASYVRSPSIPEKRTQRPVTALGGAEHASRKVALEHHMKASSQRAAAENDRYDAATKHEMLLAAAQRNVQSKLDAIDKEAASSSLRGSKEFNAMALALAEVDITGKYSATPHKVYDMGGGVYMSPEEVHGIAQQHVQPVLADLDQKAADQQKADEMARQEKERIKAERVAEKERKKDEKAEKKKQQDLEKQTRKEQKESEKQTRKEQKEEEKRRKQEEKQRKKEEKEREKALAQEKKKEEKKSKAASKEVVSPAVQGGAAEEVTTAAAVPPAAAVGAGEAPMPAEPTEHIQETEKVSGATPVTGPPPGHTAVPVDQAGGEPVGEGYETPIESCTATAGTKMPESTRVDTELGAEGYETPIEGCTTATAAQAPVRSRAEGHETPVETAPFRQAAPSAEEHETPIEGSAAQSTRVDTGSGAKTPLNAEPRPEGHETPIEERASTAAERPPQSSYTDSRIRDEGNDTPVDTSTGETGERVAESGAANHMAEEPDAGNDIEGGYDYVRPEDIVDATEATA